MNRDLRTSLKFTQNEEAKRGSGAGKQKIPAVRSNYSSRELAASSATSLRTTSLRINGQTQSATPFRITLLLHSAVSLRVIGQAA